MSKIIRTRKPSVLPYYAAALVFVVLCAVLPVYRLWALAAALAAAAAAFLAAKKVCPPRVVETEVPFHTGVEDGRHAGRHPAEAGHSAQPERIPARPAAVRRHDLHGKGRTLHCGSGGGQPRQGKAGAPLCQLLSAGRRECAAAVCAAGPAGVRGENAAAIRAEVEHNASSIATAFENQLDALYAAESMDLSADLTVLQNMLKGQGLSK